MKYRIKNSSILITILLFSIASFHALGQDLYNKPDKKSSLTLFHDMDRNIINSFTRNYGINHLIAISASYGLVESGTDWRLRTYLKEHKGIAYGGFPAVAVGGLTPLVVPVGLYYYGKLHDRDDLRVTAFALGQAAISGLIVSSAYKTLTGRREPDILGTENGESDFSDDFRFGLMNRGIFDGWPSGHTTVAWSMAAALMELYPDNRSIRIGALTYASLVGLGVSTNIHWFSDAVAGALIGYSIGKSIGSSFKGQGNKPGNHINVGFTLHPNMATIVLRN
ncbi:phosphatase PAP2 family protein [Calditrichota bacterium]